jgi:hypothetical protein
VDGPPKKKTTPRERIAQLVRLLGATERGERASAWRALERTMESVDVTWSDLGNWIEHGDGKYTEDEMLEMVAAIRKEGVEEGIKIGKARTPKHNGHIVLPEPSVMAEYCHERPNRLKDDAQRKFINQMYASTVQGINPPRGPLGYLASLYIKLGGKME